MNNKPINQKITSRLESGLEYSFYYELDYDFRENLDIELYRKLNNIPYIKLNLELRDWVTL